MKKRVLMAMSGGIDSSVASMLLLERGYEVVGVTYRVYDSIKPSCLAKEKGCCSVESIMEAKHLAEKLGFEHHIVDYRTLFRQTVIKNFIDEYMHGRTPNPCVLCNACIKWGALARLAEEKNCDFLATGHYARIAQEGDHYYLRTADDATKDQTYFLWALPQETLHHTLFPLGDYTKQQVREMAAQRGFHQLAKKSESQEICFIPDNDYRTFLREQGCTVEKGKYIDASGNVLGEHDGFCNYTIGQRKGLGIALGSPRFVTRIDAEKNEVTLGAHDDLYARTLVAEMPSDSVLAKLSAPLSCRARIRYRSHAQPATLTVIDATHFQLHFDAPVWGITPGQSAVIYRNEMLIGGGIIVGTNDNNSTTTQEKNE